MAKKSAADYMAEARQGAHEKPRAVKSTGRLDGGSPQDFREFLEKNVILVGGEDHYNGVIDAYSDDPVFVAIVVDVSGYGPHQGAISTQQNRFHGNSNAPLETASEVLEEWLLEKYEYDGEEEENITQTFDGRTWKMSAQDFAEAIRGTDAEQYIEVRSEDEEDENDEVNEDDDDPDYIIQGLYSDGTLVSGYEYGFDTEEETIREALKIANASDFEGDYTRVITRDGELVWDSREDP